MSVIDPENGSPAPRPSDTTTDVAALQPRKKPRPTKARYHKLARAVTKALDAVPIGASASEFDVALLSASLACRVPKATAYDNPAKRLAYVRNIMARPDVEAEFPVFRNRSSRSAVDRYYKTGDRRYLVEVFAIATGDPDPVGRYAKKLVDIAKLADTGETEAQRREGRRAAALIAAQLSPPRRRRRRQA